MSDLNFNIPFNPPTHLRSDSTILTGQTFDRWLVISIYARHNRNIFWLCRCRCGTYGIVRAVNLRSHKSRSCGCWTIEQTKSTNIIHGENNPRTAEYRAYANAKSRCNNPKMRRYNRYGGRGIKFLFNSYEEFLAEVGRKPSPKYTLNRIDNNGHYEKGNLEWTTYSKQNSNREPYRKGKYRIE